MANQFPPRLPELVTKALTFATNAHAGQLRKYTGQPYIVHPITVMGIVSQAGCGDAICAAALLHDVCEDCGVDPAEIDNEFGEVVGAMVREVTDEVMPGVSRAERKQVARIRLQKASPGGQTIKAADLADNTETIVQYDPGFARIYLPEKRLILSCLDRADPKVLSLAWRCLETAERLLEDHSAGRAP